MSRSYCLRRSAFKPDDYPTWMKDRAKRRVRRHFTDQLAISGIIDFDRTRFARSGIIAVTVRGGVVRIEFRHIGNIDFALVKQGASRAVRRIDIDISVTVRRQDQFFLQLAVADQEAHDIAGDIDFVGIPKINAVVAVGNKQGFPSDKHPEGLTRAACFRVPNAVRKSRKRAVRSIALELIGCNIDLLIPDQSKEKHHAMMSSRVKEVISHVRTVEGLRKDGSLVPLDISISEFSIDGAGYFTSIVRDVSVRMQKEREDKEHLDELAQVTRLGLMGEMASGLAHELNQPLTAIAGYTQACLNFLQADRPDLVQLRQVLQKTYEQALRAGQIIHRMRAFLSNKQINRSTIVINDLINVSLSLSFADLKANNIALCLDLAEHLPALCGDSVQLEQVLINLIRNSVDALKSLPEAIQRMLSIQTWLGDHHDVVIRVKDNGPGIDPAKQEKIFTPFYTSKKTGMGMGLSISQSIIKAHGGVLSFNSIPGKGTTFYFTLPVQKP